MNTGSGQFGSGNVLGVDAFSDTITFDEPGASTVPVQEIIDDDGNQGGNNEPPVEVKDPENPIVEDIEGGGNGNDDFNGLDDKPLEDQDPNKPEEKPEVKEGSFNYKSVLADMIESGLISDISAVVDGEGNEIPFESLELKTKEEFLGLLGDVLKVSRDKALENKIDSDGMSDFTKGLVEVERNGGNVNTYINTYNKYLAPIDKLDPSKKEDQKILLQHYYNLRNVAEDEINDLIEVDESKGRLESKASQVKDIVLKAYNENVEKINQDAKDAKVKRQEFVRDATKKVKAILTEGYELNDTYKKKIIEFAFNRENNEDERSPYLITRAYLEAMKDPEKIAALSLFLFDKTEYDKQASKKAVNTKVAGVYKMATMSDKNRRGTGMGLDDNDKGEKGEIRLDKLE